MIKLSREFNINATMISEDENEWTPLLLIASSYEMNEATRLKLAEELLSQGVDVHAQRKGLSVLAFASGVGGTSSRLVELLIAHGAHEFDQALRKARNWAEHYKDNSEHSQIIKILANKLRHTIWYYW